MPAQMPQMDHIEEAILSYLSKRFPAQAPFNRDSQLLDDGMIDSLGFLDLMMFLAEEFSITLDDEDFTPENLATPGHLITFVQKAA
jgi:acyl carrier protein